MTFQYQYGIYNPGQYPADVQKGWDAMVAEGWQVNTATPAYNEIYILWQRELPESEPAVEVTGSVSRDELGRFLPVTTGTAEDQTSGGLRDHEGQDAR